MGVEANSALNDLGAVAPRFVTTFGEQQIWLDDMQRAPGLEPAFRLTGIALGRHWNAKTGRCNPSAKRLAKCTSQSERNCQRHVRKIESFGWIMIETTGGRTSNSYRLVLKTTTAAVGSDSENHDSTEGVDTTPQRGSPYSNHDSTEGVNTTPQRGSINANHDTGHPATTTPRPLNPLSGVAGTKNIEKNIRARARPALSPDVENLLRNEKFTDGEIRHWLSRCRFEIGKHEMTAWAETDLVRDHVASKFRNRLARAWRVDYCNVETQPITEIAA